MAAEIDPVDATTKADTSVGPDDHRGVYGISVAADMAGTGVQNLRLYERRGLLEPSRTPGGTRLYSHSDVRRLHRIIKLLAEGLNLAGIAMVLDLQDDNTRLRNGATTEPTPPGVSPAGPASVPSALGEVVGGQVRQAKQPVHDPQAEGDSHHEKPDAQHR
jgi:DNA-binding transcriptional MerR regulator